MLQLEGLGFRAARKSPQEGHRETRAGKFGALPSSMGYEPGIEVIRHSGIETVVDVSAL